MSDHPNVELIRRGYEAFGKGDMKTVDELFADDIVWHNGGRGPLAGDLRSKKEVFEFFGELAERSNGTFAIEIHDVVGGDEHVVVLSTAHATRNGRSLDAQGADIWHVCAAARPSSSGISTPMRTPQTSSGRNGATPLRPGWTQGRPQARRASHRARTPRTPGRLRGGREGRR